MNSFNLSVYLGQSAKYLVSLIILAGILGDVAAQDETPVYSFFTAGHAYGSPQSPQYGLHPPFADYIPSINNYPQIELGFLTGDVVVQSTADYWDAAQLDIDELNMPVHIAAGNHDISQEFLNRFESYYYSFTHQNDLFIILTPGLDSWNISGDQLEFLTNTIDNNYAQVNNIFIFLHELVWWSPENQYQHVQINYEPHYPGYTNFDDVIKPLLLSYPIHFTLYAGDLGSSDNGTPFMYHSFDNITLIAGGMGGGIRDNIVITEVYEDSVYHNLVAINGTDPKALGELASHSRFGVINGEMDYVNIYPNPFSSTFNVDFINSGNGPVEFELCNAFGQVVLSFEESSTIKYSYYKFHFEELGSLRSGYYILRIKFGGKTRNFPVIKN